MLISHTSGSFLRVGPSITNPSSFHHAKLEGSGGPRSRYEGTVPSYIKLHGAVRFDPRLLLPLRDLSPCTQSSRLSVPGHFWSGGQPENYQAMSEERGDQTVRDERGERWLSDI